MEIHVLGPLEVVSSAGARVVIGSAKQRELLALLAAHAPEVISTDRIVDALWGDDGQDRLPSLHFHVSKLRDVVDPDRDENVIVTAAPGYGLGIAIDSVDAHRFRALVARAERLGADDLTEERPLLEEALGMWRGSPYAEFEYAEWARSEVLHLEELRLVATELRIDADLATGRHSGLVPELESLAAEYPLRERFWGQLMTALYRSGRQPEALRAYRRAYEVFAGLGIAPSAELEQLEEQILRRDAALQPGPDLPPGATPSMAPNNLPLQRTSFVGRERELALGGELLKKSRLLTLTGPPGSGKTRMAVRLAVDHLTDFPGGSFFVPLAAVTDPQLIATAVSRALGLREVLGETNLQGLKAYLHDRRALLILDNFEQIVEGAPLVGELLDAAPDVKIVATSRSPLGLSGEQEFLIPPLGVPPVDPIPDPETLSVYDAVALFRARARASDPSFELSSANAASVAEIASRLDGLPLAIELAAARVKMLTPQELMSRLEKRLAVLTGGPADVADHHRTLRDAIAWSYELLQPDERVLFRRLGVFRGFNLEAAAAVAGLANGDILNGIDSLLSKSLVFRSVGIEEAHFAMLETLREFALEELEIAGETQEVTRRHAGYVLRLAEESEPQLTGKTPRIWIELLSRELENVRGALQFALDANDPDLGLRIAGSIWRFWEISGHLAEGRQWLETLLTNRMTSDSVRAKGLTGLAGLAYWQADHDVAWDGYREALGLYQAIGDRFNEADTLSSMSMTAIWNGDPDVGERLAKEARSLFEDLGAKEEIGRIQMAQAFALTQKRELAAARPLWEASLALSRELGYQSLAITQLIGLAACEFHEGNQREALQVALEALEEAADAQNVQLAVWMLDFFAAFAASTAPEAAVRLSGAVNSLRRVLGGGKRLEPLGIEDGRSVAAGALDTETLERCLAEGRAMTLDQAVDYAKELKSASEVASWTGSVDPFGEEHK